MANENDDFDRPRGIFTPRDRRFLAGDLDEELTSNAERQKRYQLRQRVFHALQDLRYLERMETRDLGQLAEAAGYGPEGGGEDVYDTEHYRIWSGATEFLAFIREVYGLERFKKMVRAEVEIQAKLDHYEETGEYGDFDVEIAVTQTGSTPIEELLDTPRANPPLELGMWAVLALHEARKGIDREWREYTPTEPELMDRAKEVVESLDEGGGVPRERVVAVLVDEHEATEPQAEDAIEDILKSGLGYEPMEGRLKTI